MLTALALVLMLSAQPESPAAPATPDAPPTPPAPAAPAPAVDAQAKALHEAGRAATSKLAGVAYKAELKATGAVAMSMPPVKGAVTFVKGQSEFEDIPGRFLVEAEVSDGDPATPRKVQMAFDGKTMTLIDHSARQFGRAEMNDNPMAMATVYDPALNLLVWHYFNEDSWGQEEEIAGYAQAGTAEVDGVKCDIVVVEHRLDEPGPGADEDAKPQTLAIREFLGAEDHLLRRVEFPLSLPGDAEPALLTIELSELKADPQVDAALFAPAIPEGYTKKPDVEIPGMAGPALKEGDEAPAWTASDPEGKSHSLADYKGKLVVLDFWATWCGPCRAAMPAVQKIHERFKDRPVAVIGMNISEDEEAKPAEFMKDKGFTYGLLLKADQAAEDYGVVSIPHIFVIGVDGKIIHSGVGFDESEADALITLIEAHLKANTR